MPVPSSRRASPLSLVGHRLTRSLLSGVVLSSGLVAGARGQEAEIALDTISVAGAARPVTATAAGTQPGGARGPVPGYVASRSVVATKTDTPILETAQSITVIGREQIEDQNALTINQALRYSPSVTTEQRGGAGGTRLEQFAIRGFTAPLFLDGMRLPTSRDAFPSVDPYRIERIDIVKGPASVLYGQSGPGGIVNLTSKMPQFVRHGEVFVQGGGFSEVRGGFDVGGPITSETTIPGSEEFAYRVTGLGWNGDGPAVTTRVERAFIQPSLTWRPSADTSLTVLGLYQRDPFSGFYGGFPAFGTVFPRNFGSGIVGRLPVDFYDGDRNFEQSDRTQAAVTYILDHRFDDAFRFHSSGRFLRTEGQYRSVYGAFSGNTPLLPATALTTGPLINRSRIATDVAIDAYTMDNYVEAKFDTGPFAHTALFGVDHQTIKTRTLSTPFPAAPDLNALTPNYDMTIAVPGFTSNARITAQQTGVYLQDQIKFDRLVLTLGGRYDTARTTGPTRTLATGAVAFQDLPADAFTYRASLLYRFDGGVAPYVSYSEAFEPIASGRIYDPAFGTTGRIPDPISSRQYEAGIKYQPPGTDILLTAAAFDIKRSNTLTPDPVNGPTFSLQTGEIGVQGVEFEARATLAEGLNLVGGVSFLDVRNTRDTNTTFNQVTGRNVPIVGLRPVQVPDRTASLFVDYRFQSGPLTGLTLGGGVRYLGGSWGDPANTFRVPEAVLVDAVAAYDLKHLNPTLTGFDLQVNAQNLLDDRTVTGCFSYATCFYGLPRTVYATLRYRW